jgi:hypothetical protein
VTPFGAFILWKPLHRGQRLAAHDLLARLLPADTAVIRRAVAEHRAPAGLAIWLQEMRPHGARPDRYREERYLLAMEATRKVAGLPKIADADIYRLRHDGIGLDAESALMAVWEQCVARWHARNPSDIPRSVKLIITGAQDFRMLEEDVATLLAEDDYLRRRKALPPDRHPNLREEVIRQWVEASGGNQGHLDIVTRMLGRDADVRLAELATGGGYATLAPEMVDLARQLANGNATLGFYVFRVLQRVAAGTVDGKSMWKATWLRGVKTDPNAIPGTSAHQVAINEILKTRVFEEEPAKGHSGAASIATTFRLRLDIRPGPCGPHDAARLLGLRLNSKGMPRRGG